LFVIPAQAGTEGLASSDVTLADPAVGTGTFILGVLRKIAADVEASQGPGAVPPAIESAIGRLIAFEMQLGPFAVAQLRVFAELLELIGKPPRAVPRMFVTDTLDNPYAEVEELGSPTRRTNANLPRGTAAGLHRVGGKIEEQIRRQTCLCEIHGPPIRKA
jgi:predicted helicase